MSQIERWSGLLTAPWRVVFMRASARRALLEALLLWALALCVVLFQTEVPPQELLPYANLALGPACALLFALRLRRPEEQGWRAVALEALLGSILSSIINGTMLALMLASSLERTMIEIGLALLLLFGATAITWLAFVALRGGMFLLMYFDTLRRRHIRWSLTYALLVVISLLMVPIALLNLKWTAPAELPGSVILNTFYLLSQLILLLIPLMLLLLVLFVPLALFSYFVVHRTTRGIEALVDGAKALQAGDYRTRVEVCGEDEVAELQVAFNAMATDLERAMQELQEEREKADRLLLNVLPGTIADRLKQEPLTIADSFDEATVLFADIVDFTGFSANISPTELVELLNQIFSAFDHLAERYGLEKIKTIGDAYMAVGGLPEPRPDHAQAVAEMALAMQREIQRFNRTDGNPFAIRIGINSGPVVAGVIGLKKFIYDLWGDTVNLASRMESQGLGGCIQVTDSAYERLRDYYHFEERGIIQVKGRGEMTTYLLMGRMQEALVVSQGD